MRKGTHGVAVDQIEVTVRFFAAPREALDTDTRDVQLPAGSKVSDLLGLLERRHPLLKNYTRFLNVAVNRAYVGMQTELTDGDEVAFLPPVGGG